MTLHYLMLIGFLISAPWLNGRSQGEVEVDAERRLAEMQRGLRSLGSEPDPGEELFFSMECGLALIELERYSLAKPYFERVADLARDLDEHGMLVMSLSNLIRVSFHIGDLESARRQCTEAMALAVAMDRVEYVTRLATNLGSIELRSGNFGAAVDAFTRALKVGGTDATPLDRAALLSNLGVAYMSLERFDEALETLDEALPIMEEAGSHEGIAAVLSNRGDVMLLAGDPEGSLEVMEEALAIRVEHGITGDSSISHRSIGQALLALGRPEEALDSLERALEIQRELDLKPEVVSTLVAIADAYAILDRYEESTAAAAESAQIAEATSTRDRHVLALTSLARAYEGQGDLERALECERKARELDELRDGNGLARALAGFRARYEAQQRAYDQLVQGKEDDLHRQQRVIQILALTLAILVGVAGWVSFIRNRRTLNRLDQAHSDLREANERTLAHSEQLEGALQEVQALEEEHLRAGKFESLGLLAAGIAHDFNNMLAVVLGNVSIARHTLHDRPNEEEMLADAEAAIRQGRRLSSQLLAFSKGGAPLRTMHAMPNLLREAAGLAAAGSRARLTFDLSPDLWPAEIDVGQVSQLIGNLVLNAVQAMPDGGTIEVAAENVPADPEREITQPLIRIWVRDSGHGIPKDIRQKIFDPYFTTKGDGTGLGLTTAYAIADRHGGTIRVNSSGDGSVFECDLPAVPGGLEEESGGIDETPLGSGRVLVLDDDPLVRTFYERALTKLGYDPEIVSSADESLRAFETALATGRPFSAVILDLTLPGDRSGTEVFEELRERDPDIRAIVASGYAEAPVLANHEALGFAGVLPKPFEIQALAGVLSLSISRTPQSHPIES